MNKIWSFGDSFAEGRCSDVVDIDGKLNKTYANYLGSIQNITDIEVNAMGGYSRLDIAGRILNKIGKIKKDDYVLILRTDSMRNTILPAKLNLKDTFLPKKIHGKYPRDKNNQIDYLSSVNVRDSLIFSPNQEDNNLHVLNKEERTLLRDFYLNIFLKHRDNFVNYFDSFFESAIYSLKDITPNVCIIDSSVWAAKLDYMADEYFEDSSDLYCKCKHWNYKLHEIVGILIDTAINNNELYVSDETCDNLWTIFKKQQL
tara:strand:+ start:403 stop:1176 length:774 start_codon:yes stop_codon:yes gene_type:complete